MIVVADTTPLRYLVVIEREHLLPALYGRVLIPPAVADELSHENTPAAVRAPGWPRNRVGSKSGNQFGHWNLKSIWTGESERRLRWQKRLLPTCYW
ncbi:MAG TPA: hypothetical protein VNY05_21950 [Candidatus Acidoferrales bacterium]|jgi:hypothetical protein|nr:hypothetical protein [Candidatus Acidoferrales bacterium]